MPTDNKPRALMPNVPASMPIDPVLSKLLQQAAGQKMTPMEIWRQRISYVAAESDSTPKEVEARLRENGYGPPLPASFVIIDTTAPAADRARQAAKVLEGTEWCVVPREATEAMLKAARDSDREYTDYHLGKGTPIQHQGGYDHWDAMLAASPLAAAAPETEQSHAPR